MDYNDISHNWLIKKGESNIMRKKRTKKVRLKCRNKDEKLLIEWYRDNPLSVYIGLSLIAMLRLGIITKDEYNKYLLEVYKKADILKVCSRKYKLGCHKIS